MATVRDHIKCLGLNIGAAHDLPCQILLGQLGVGCLFGLLRNRVHSFRSIVVVSETNAVYETRKLVHGEGEVVRAGTDVIVRLFEPIHGDMDWSKVVSVGRRMRLRAILSRSVGFLGTWLFLKLELKHKVVHLAVHAKRRVAGVDVDVV